MLFALTTQAVVTVFIHGRTTHYTDCCDSCLWWVNCSLSLPRFYPSVLAGTVFRYMTLVQIQ